MCFCVENHVTKTKQKPKTNKELDIGWFRLLAISLGGFYLILFILHEIFIAG